MTSFAQQNRLQGSSPDLQPAAGGLQGGAHGVLQGAGAAVGAGIEAVRQRTLGNAFLQQLLQQRQQVDLSQYEWLVNIYVTTGALEQAEAEALVQAASAAQLQQAMAGEVTTEDAAAGGNVPAADLGTSDRSRAQPLDWQSAPRRGHMSPETPDAEGHDAATETMQSTFQEHRSDLMTEDFGAGVTLEQVRQAISLAQLVEQPAVASHLQARLSRVNQHAVVSSLNVEDSGRYAPTGTATYCNIYAYDFVTAMGAYIPRVWWYDAAMRRIEAGEQVAPVYGETVYEVNANGINRWLDTYGAGFGWTQAADMTAAQAAANAGSVVITSAANRNARASGHISVVLPERGDSTAQRHEDETVEAPLQSQAGASNFNADHNSRGLGQDQWWEDTTHTNGGAWINRGGAGSPIVTPEALGR